MQLLANAPDLFASGKKKQTKTAENLLLMRLIDEQYMRHPEVGSPRMTNWLRDEEYEVYRKRESRLMQLQTITLEPHTSNPVPIHKVYPYL